MKFLLTLVICSILIFNQGCQKHKKLESKDGMILISAGEFQMGTSDGMLFESPVHKVALNAFWIDEHEVSVAEFNEFVNKTGYKTEAKKFGWSAVFDIESGEWEKAEGANWQQPEGKNSRSNPEEPVCQISWNDANEYARFVGKRLPTEAEFEYAARGGLVGNKYSWGNDLKPNGKPVANWWQGEFPSKNTVEDGFIQRSSIKKFTPNGYGLYDITGNVWEWTNDYYADDYYTKSPKDNPKGAENGEQKSIRGGSWICAENICSNYRVAARSKATPDSAMNNLGFRCVKDSK